MPIGKTIFLSTNLNGWFGACFFNLIPSFRLNSQNLANNFDKYNSKFQNVKKTYDISISFCIDRAKANDGPRSRIRHLTYIGWLIIPIIQII